MTQSATSPAGTGAHRYAGPLERLLATWLPTQRWYPLKEAGDIAPVRIVRTLELPGTPFALHFVQVDVPDAAAGRDDGGAPGGAAAGGDAGGAAGGAPAGGGVGGAAAGGVDDGGAAAGGVDDGGPGGGAATGPVLLNVPLGTCRSLPAGLPETAVLGAVRAGHQVYDALADPAFMDAWLDLVSGEAEVDGVHAWHGAHLPPLAGGAPHARNVRSVGAEQSNTSVVFDLAEESFIAKFYRVLHPGTHPEVALGRALAEAQGDVVPELHAAVVADPEPTIPVFEVAAPAPGADAGEDPGTTLGVIHSFMRGARDGWDCALSAAGNRADFTAEAHAMGAALAQVHQNLRDTLGAHECSDREADELVDALVRRMVWAWGRAGAAVRAHEEEFADFVVQLRYLVRLPAVQRIHGDLHLGQILHVVGPDTDRWHILDFEGEPMRPLAERCHPDMALRDIVGMARSFDYAGAQAAKLGLISAAEGAGWARACSKAFITGYHGADPGDLFENSVLFKALWLDKALYEVVYELQNRPDWAGVPVRAVQDLFGTKESEEDMGLEKATPLAVETEVLARVSEGTHHAPHSVLGAHLDDTGHATVRTLRHLAESVTLVTADARHPMEHEHAGIWTAVVPVVEAGHVPDYRLEVRYADGLHKVDDPYRYLPTVGELDLHLINEGRHETLWTTLGAHVHRYHSSLGEVTGVGFAVWAPAVRAVRVIGDFNNWDGRTHAMRSLGSSGVWELFIPDVAAGAHYKYEILSADGRWLEKADPMAFGTEQPPLTASVVVESGYAFKDQEWMQARAARDPHNSPMSVYEVHLGSWRLGLSYRELAKELVEYVQWLGFTHVEFMPVAEHPFGGSWGYQVTSYYAPTSRFGHPDEFRHLVDALHQAGIGVIMDWVPAHFPKDEWALARFNGGPLYEHADPRLGEHPDWGTLIFDYGRNEVRNFLVANALFWLEEFHIDALRVDAVASMLYLDYSREEGQWSPNRYGGRENLDAISFLQEVNATAYRRNPGIVMIAEESTAFPGVTKPTEFGGLGFGLKWNMGWMHDSLAYMAEDPVNRGWHHNQITFSMVYAFTENFLLPISHDEVVHGKGSLLRKMPGDRWQQLANLRAYLAFQWAHPGKQLVFMGTEFGQEAEWSEQHGLDWWLTENPPHRGVQLLVKELNELYASTPALSEVDNAPEGFSWINGGDTEHNIISFIRYDRGGEPLVCIVNFSGVAYEGHRVGLPLSGSWQEVLNTDSAGYGGSDVVNQGVLTAQKQEWDGREHSTALRIPPLGAVYLRPAR